MFPTFLKDDYFSLLKHSMSYSRSLGSIFISNCPAWSNFTRWKAVKINNQLLILGWEVTLNTPILLSANYFISSRHQTLPSGNSVWVFTCTKEKTNTYTKWIKEVISTFYCLEKYKHVHLMKDGRKTTQVKNNSNMT